MQSLIRKISPLRRQYSTKPPKVFAPTSLGARTASTPLAVRLRRQKKFGRVVYGASDANESGVTPSDHARYERRRALRQIPQRNGRRISEAEWIKKVDERRSRIRGLKVVQRKDGIEETEVLGRRVYLPNIIFRLVRNQTPPGQPYNPYEATFRIPNSMTKTDVRSYLAAVYGVKTTYIRTDNYISQFFPKLGNVRKSFKTYKRAVVGLVDPFYYPHRIEDLPEKERVDRENFIESQFSIQQTRNMQKFELLRLTKGVLLKAPFATKRSHILRLVAERRATREGLVAGYAAEFQEMRAKGEHINVKKVLQKAGVLPSPSDGVSSVPAVS